MKCSLKSLSLYSNQRRLAKYCKISVTQILETLILPVVCWKRRVCVWCIVFQDQSAHHSIHEEHDNEEQLSYAFRFYPTALFSRPTPMLSRKKPKTFCLCLWLICCFYNECEISKYTHIYYKQTSCPESN